jgi:hypothetical protein
MDTINLWFICGERYGEIREEWDSSLAKQLVHSNDRENIEHLFHVLDDNVFSQVISCSCSHIFMREIRLIKKKIDEATSRII